MTKRNEEGWMMEYCVKQNQFADSPLLHYSRIILLNFDHFDIPLTFEFFHLSLQFPQGGICVTASS